jgi:hypothetical protein
MGMTDATPVPCGMSRETTKRSDLAGHGGYGYCASHSRWYWGMKLYLVCSGDGMPIMWCLANPKLGERQVLAALLDHNHHLIRTAQILLADKGFAGAELKQTTATMGLRLLRPDRKDETYRNGNLGGVRQWIESVNQTLKTTARGPSPGYSPASPNACWPSPPGSGTTGPPVTPANDH